MRWLRRIGLGIAVLIAGTFLFAAATRFADGPVGPFPGGEFTSGESADGPPDWKALTDEREVEFQLLEPPRSRTTWILVHEGSAYIPCIYPNVSWLKQWPHEVLADGRGVLRVRGVRYPVQAVKVDAPETFSALKAVAVEKYGGSEEGDPDPDMLWFFRLDPRPRS